ncbi:hypothetical protein DPMN_031993 [Dreissena polymorpha]|uniref:Uncharacterized protein n=1 Tax=Dreissena polymorpha TaxID=45954 RepID=A0A9D4M3U3_DREPO|nr:hypothetical protein DPMN_031993 [Dreissena polymorpha]
MTSCLFICNICRPVRSASGTASWVKLPGTWLARDPLSRHHETKTHSKAEHLELNQLKTLVGKLEYVFPLQKSTIIPALKILNWLLKQEIPHSKLPPT